MSEVFQQREECRHRLQHLLAIELDAGNVPQGMLDAFADSCEEETPPSSQGFGARIRRWVIRDEDLKLFETIKEATFSLAAVNFILADLSLASVVAIASTLVRLLRNGYRAGAVVSVPQMQILTVLEHAKVAQTADEILAHLPKHKEILWDRDRVVKELQALKEIVTKNGKVAFVDNKSDGHWFLSGV